MSKLTPEQVEEAKKLHKEGWTYKELGERYGVSKQCINQRVQSDIPRIDILKRENRKLKLENNFLRMELRRNGIDVGKVTE